MNHDTLFHSAVQEVFEADGPIAAAAEAYRARPGQVRMALAVARTIESGGELVVEAATGVGKTFAYLVPALLSGERVLLSTATKALQDQLFGRDLPHLARALGIPVRMALLKGRGSYLCLHRLEFAVQGLEPSARQQHVTLGRIERWARMTQTGDLAELPWLDERSPLIPLVTSTRENCLGADCPHFRDCFVNKARREAMAADVVVVNHHLFFADLAIRESGMAELLPTVRVAIFDEAHQLNETGIQFLGEQLGTSQLLELAHDVLTAGLAHARGLANWNGLANELETAGRDLRLVVGRRNGRLRWQGPAPEGVDEAHWLRALVRVHEALDTLATSLAGVSELAPDFSRLQERALQLSERAERFLDACDPTLVRWVDVSGALRLRESPLDIAEAVHQRLLARPADAAGAEDGSARPRAWVFVSATLGDDKSLGWFTEPCGLEQAETLRIGSPFDFARQAAIHVPRDMVRPGDPMHSVRVAELAGDAAARLGGRTLILTTTLRALATIGETLKQRFEPGSNIEVLVQGQAPKRVLMDVFRDAGQGSRPGCILVASASFWEGIDLPGQTLQLVVIDKLPFPPPSDPLVEARSRRIETQGRSPFADYSLPEAAVALRQGAGRLIRRESDRGVLVICDPRLATMGYGRRLQAALPPMRQLVTAADFDAALEWLVRGDDLDAPA